MVKSLLENVHHVLFEFLPREALKLSPLCNLLSDKLVIILGLVLEPMGSRGVLLVRLATGLHRKTLIELSGEVLTVDGLLGIGQS